MPKIPDSAPEKWVYEQHMRMKHEIFAKYLKPWITVLGRYHGKVVIFDGFAGRGEYNDGTSGSPVLAMATAQPLIEARYVKEVVCFFIEANPENHENLAAVLEEQAPTYPLVHASDPILGTFTDTIEEVLDKFEGNLAPSFFFVDPFGFAGVPFALLERILHVPRTEVLLTFMYRDINRFLSAQVVEPTMDSLFGTKKWRDLLQLDSGVKEMALRDLYIGQLRSVANYAWPFRVCSDDKASTLYYLIHATNSFKGLDIMKGIMYKQGPTSPFAYLGPKDAGTQGQLSLITDDSDDLGELGNYLGEALAGKTLTYDQIKEQTYQDTNYIDKHYRQALKDLKSAGAVSIRTVSSKTERGLKGADEVTFR